jgi:hypothetical protein
MMDADLARQWLGGGNSVQQPYSLLLFSLCSVAIVNVAPLQCSSVLLQAVRCVALAASSTGAPPELLFATAQQKEKAGFARRTGQLRKRCKQTCFHLPRNTCIHAQNLQAADAADASQLNQQQDAASPPPSGLQGSTTAALAQPQQQRGAVPASSGGGRSSFFFARVPPTMTHEQLVELFSKYGTVEDLNLFRPFAEAKTSKVQ